MPQELGPHFAEPSSRLNRLRKKSAGEPRQAATLSKDDTAFFAWDVCLKPQPSKQRANQLLPDLHAIGWREVEFVAGFHVEGLVPRVLIADRERTPLIR